VIEKGSADISSTEDDSVGVMTLNPGTGFTATAEGSSKSGFDGK
jgi:hypothetical protein